MLSFIKNLNLKEEISILVKLVLPIVGTQFGLILLSVIDSMMAGQIDVRSLSALGLATSIAFPLIIIVSGTLAGVSILNSHAFGEKNYKRIVSITHQGLYVCLLLIAVLASFLYFNEIFVRPILQNMKIAQEDPEIINITVGYLHMLSFGFPALVFFSLLRSYLEAQGKTFPVSVVTFAAIPLNIVLDYVFMYGNYGIPAMGAVGTAVATSIVYCFMLISLIFYSMTISKSLLFKKLQSMDSKLVKDILFLGVPIAINILFEVIIFAILPFLAIPFGTVSVAAAQIAVNFSGLVFQIPLAMSMAFTIRLSHILGANQLKQATEVGRFFILLSFLIGLFNSIIFTLFARNVITLYSQDELIISVTLLLFFIVNIYQIPDAMLCGLNGILRAFKDTRFPMWMVGLSYWVIAIPMGYYISNSSIYDGSDKIAAYFWGLVGAMTTCAVVFLYRFRYIRKKFAKAAHSH